MGGSPDRPFPSPTNSDNLMLGVSGKGGRVGAFQSNFYTFSDFIIM